MCAVVIFPQNINIGVHCPVILDLWTSKTGDSGIFEERGLKAMAKWGTIWRRAEGPNTRTLLGSVHHSQDVDDPET